MYNISFWAGPAHVCPRGHMHLRDPPLTGTGQLSMPRGQLGGQMFQGLGQWPDPQQGRLLVASNPFVNY